MYKRWGGMRMMESLISLSQMTRTTLAINELKKIIFLILFVHRSTAGGITASYAIFGDIRIAEPGALIAFAGQKLYKEQLRKI